MPGPPEIGRLTRVIGSGVVEALVAAGELVLPRACAGCDRPGATLCTDCRRGLVELALPTLAPLAPHPVPPGWPGCSGSLRYSGLAPRLVHAFKDGERRDLAAVLGPLLADGVRRAVAREPRAPGTVLVVPVPSSPAAVRRRGDQPTLLLARRAVRALGRDFTAAPVLRMRRGTADQAALDRAGRQANLAGAMTTTAPARVRGRHCVLVDDVLTSGATLSEGRRALLAAGASRVDLAVVMVTPRRTASSGLPFRTCPD